MKKDKPNIIEILIICNNLTSIFYTNFLIKNKSIFHLELFILCFNQYNIFLK